MGEGEFRAAGTGYEKPSELGDSLSVVGLVVRCGIHCDPFVTDPSSP